jgi:subtilisin family serine protease
VAATDLFDRKASFSNFGDYVFVDCAGNTHHLRNPGGGYGIASGTSFSAPMVAGMAALIRSLRYNDTVTVIAQSTVRIDGSNPKYSGKLGYGRVDIRRAVRTR